MKKNKGKNDIMQYIFDDYIFNRDLTTASETLKNLDLLVENKLAVKISGREDLMSMGVSKYRLACKFMCKQNKKFLESKREVGLDYEYGATYKFADDDPKITELGNYSLVEGIYSVVLEESDYAVLKITSPDSEDEYIVGYELYFIGRHCNKWKNKFFKMVDEYNKLKKQKKTQRIMYSDRSPSKIARFKTIDTLILKDKEKIVAYVDNWVTNIPKYYNDYGMIPKLSILLYGKPGTGKSTFYKALADYLKINDIFCIKPSYFYEDDSHGGMRPRGGCGQTIVAIDDIDCVCKARKDVDKEDSMMNDKVLSNLLAFLDNPETFYFKAKDDLYYPVQIVIATTNYIEKLDPAVVRYGRFDLKVEMNEFDREEAEKMCATYDLTLKDVIKGEIKKDFIISPSKLQALCMENIDRAIKKQGEKLK